MKKVEAPELKKVEASELKKLKAAEQLKVEAQLCEASELKKVEAAELSPANEECPDLDEAGLLSDELDEEFPPTQVDQLDQEDPSQAATQVIGGEDLEDAQPRSPDASQVDPHACMHADRDGSQSLPCTNSMQESESSDKQLNKTIYRRDIENHTQPWTSV